ncbi:MAG: ABC transporter permease [Synergistaceae bacterium]|nr:ABC transporter permease [Synergistaceae bacterium]MBQ3763472.1 ABC transporter permease [Synergistaceae bacterium]MBQ6112815.1 ABC transporter permease [Synergistaceae bacterium]MBQ6919884.1 ABC transporter permease [Synergistaceae bacterium]MBQ6969004.1 ABC transporter permease [Synergistaceae bacterium]
MSLDAAPNSLKAQNGFTRYFKENMGTLIGLFAMCLILSFTTNGVFYSQRNLVNVLRQVSSNACLAFGMTFAIITGGIDLSVGSILALSGTLSAGFIVNSGLSVQQSVIAAIVIGTALGLFNGFMIAKTTIPPFIVTLAMMQIARGAAYIYSNGQPIRAMIPEYQIIGTGYLGPVPYPVIYMIVFLIICVVLLSKTRFGRHVYAVGGNDKAAIFSGVNVARTKMLVYTMSGFLAAFTGVVLCARMASGQPTAGQSFEMDAIAATVLGGTSMSGGVGKIGSTMIGVLIIGVLNNGLNLLGLNSFWQQIAKGIVILLAVYVDMLKKRRK